MPRFKDIPKVSIAVDDEQFNAIAQNLLRLAGEFADEGVPVHHPDGTVEYIKPKRSKDVP